MNICSTGAGELARKAERERAKCENLEIRTWLSSQQAAKYAGYSEGSWSSFIRLGLAPLSIKCGRNVRRFRRTDVDAWRRTCGLPQQRRARKCGRLILI